MDGPPSDDWLLWQLADSAFPAGGFAHSGGLEPPCQLREIKSRLDLAGFIETALRQLSRAAIPFINTAYSSPDRYPELDHLCHAFTSNHVANRASRAQGLSFLSTVERAFSFPQFTALKRLISESALPGHFAPIFGRVCRHLSLKSLQTNRLFLFLQLRNWISSAVRLGIIGPMEGQGMQTRFWPLAEELLHQSSAYTLDHLAQTAPLLDLYQGLQDRLYSRLFQS